MCTNNGEIRMSLDMHIVEATVPALTNAERRKIEFKKEALAFLKSSRGFAFMIVVAIGAGAGFGFKQMQHRNKVDKVLANDSAYAQVYKPSSVPFTCIDGTKVYDKSDLSFCPKK